MMTSTNVGIGDKLRWNILVLIRLCSVLIKVIKATKATKANKAIKVIKVIKVAKSVESAKSTESAENAESAKSSKSSKSTNSAKSAKSTKSTVSQTKADYSRPYSILISAVLPASPMPLLYIGLVVEDDHQEQ